MTCHDSSPNYIPVGINYNNVTGKATGLAEIRTLDVAEIKPVDGNLIISGSTVEIKTTNLILSSDVDVFIPGNLTVSGTIIGETSPVNLDAYITSSIFNPFSSTVNSHIGTADIHFTSGGLVAYTDTIYPALNDYNSHIGSGTVHYTSGSLSGYYAASSWVEANYTDNSDFNAHTGSGTVHFTSGSLSSYYAVSTVVDSRLSTKQNQDSTLDAIANITTGASTLIYFSGVDQAATTTLSDFARNILDDSNATTVRSTIGTVIGTDVQGYSNRLKDLDDIGTGNWSFGGVTGPAGNAAWGTIPFVKLIAGAVSGFYPLSAGPTENGRFLRVIDLGGGFYEPFWSTFNLTEVADVADTAPGTNTFLRYDGSVWSGVSASLSGSLGDVYISSTPSPGAFLFWSDTQKAWITSYPVGGPPDPDSPGIENLRNVNSSSVTPETNPLILDGDPFVWDSAASAWSHRNITNFAGNIAPELAPYYVSAGGGTYASSNYRVSSLSATTVVVSASISTAVPLQVRFAPNSTTSHVLFASADGTEIARLNLRGTNNLFFGRSSGNSWSTGSNNVAIGHQASQFLSTGSDTVAIGSNANYNSTTAQRNTSIGSHAGGYPGTSTDNVNIGYYAGYTQTGSFNISIGPSVNYGNVGSRNVGLGYQALYRNTSGTGNVGLGYRAGLGFSSTASNNIAIGHDANITEPTTYSNTIVIGSGTNSTASNQTIIGHPSTSSTLIRGAVSATSYVNAPTTSGTFTSGDVLYYNGSVWVSLPKPTNQAVLIFQSGASYPSWIEASPGLGTYSLQSIDGTIGWAG